MQCTVFHSLMHAGVLRETIGLASLTIERQHLRNPPTFSRLVGCSLSSLGTFVFSTGQGNLDIVTGLINFNANLEARNKVSQSSPPSLFPPCGT